MKINSNWIFNWNLYTSRKFRGRLSSEDKKTNTDDIPTNKDTKGITEKGQKPTMFGPLALGLQQPNDGCPKSHGDAERHPTNSDAAKCGKVGRYMRL